MTVVALFGATAASRAPVLHESAALPMNLRPHSTGEPFAPSATSRPPTTADHLEPLPQPPVHDPSGASFMEAEVSRTIMIFAGTLSAGTTAPQPLSGYPATPVAGPAPAKPRMTE